MAEQDETPSVTEQHLQEVIAAYLKAREAGQMPDQQEWLARHPEHAGPLASFFAEHEHLRRVMGPLRPVDGGGIAETIAIPSTTAGVSETPSAGADRYRLQRFHARGGMGEVWLAEDCRINRPVAVKRLRSDRSELHERFDDEAQITGQLEHPAIVPVHDAGVDAEGRPFYVMKFVDGTTLKEVIQNLHAPNGPTGSEREVTWTRLLKVFIDLCQAVAFAHSRGVVHRDLKPDNVMLGPYGETLLVDWGLAKVAARGEEAAAGATSASVRLSRASGSTDTHAGSVLGTPSYMAPEVAGGRIEPDDPRTDVYLLGATLYEILTGQPPRRGSSLPEMMELARTVDPTPPRKIDPRIRRPLEAICLKALARRPEDRYASAQHLAHDVERYLAGEPVSAYREGVLERAARWIKRHRRAIGRIAVASLVLGAIVFGLVALRKAQRIEEQEAARRDLETFRYLNDEAQYYLASTDTPDERAPYYDLERGEVSAQAARTTIQKWGDRLERLPLPDQQDRCKDDLYGLILLLVQARLSRQAGQPQELLDLLDQAASLTEPSRGYYRLQAEVFRLLKEDTKAAEAAQRAEAAETRATALDYFLLGEHYRMRRKASATSPRPVPGSGAPAGESDGNLLAKAVEEYGKALQQDPRHYWSHFQLGRCYLAMGRGPEAVQTLSTCVALRPETPWGPSARGLALALLSRFDEAERELERTIAQHPGFLPARLNHGVALWLQSRQTALPAEREARQHEALAEFNAVLQPAAPATPLIEAAFYCGQIHLDRGELAGALADFSRVIAERPRFAPAYALRAKTHFLAGRNEEGLQDLTTLAGMEAERTLDPESAQAYRQRGGHLRRLAAELEGAAQARVLDCAADQLRKALKRGGPSAALLDDLGAALELQGRLAEAIEAYSQGLSCEKPEQHPKEHVKLYVKRGWAYTKLEDQSKKALADFSQAIRLDPRDAEACSGVSYALACLKVPVPAQFTAHALRRGSDDYLILHNLACVLAELSRSEGAEARLWQDLALVLLSRAVEFWKTELARQGTAIANERELIRIDPALKPLQSRPEFQKLLKGD